MIKFLEKFKKKSSAIHTSEKINPHKHWMILTRVFLVVVLLLIVFSLYLLYQIKNEQIFQVDPTNTEKPGLLKEDLLKKVTDSFKQKALKERELGGHSDVTIDSSSQ